MNETVRTLIFFDSTGKIYFSMTVDEIPTGLERFVFNIPENKQVERMDMTDPKNPVPVYAEIPESDMTKAQKDIENLEIALAEIYEMIIGE